MPRCPLGSLHVLEREIGDRHAEELDSRPSLPRALEVSDAIDLRSDVDMSARWADSEHAARRPQRSVAWFHADKLSRRGAHPREVRVIGRDEDVDVAVRPEIVAQNGPEERELGNAMARAERGDVAAGILQA